MESSHGMQVSSGGGSPSDRLQGISTSLKVAALAAGYAAFVWFTMFQLERSYLAMQGTPSRTASSTQSDGGNIAGPGEVRFATKASAAVRAGTETSPATLPGAARAGVRNGESF
jgi:hypothetical protein